MGKIVKRKKAKKQVLRMCIFGIFCTGIIVAILAYTSQTWVQISAKYEEKKELETKLVGLQAKEEELTINVKKLSDPEYVARYLREKYFYSKDGEYIIRIPNEGSTN